MTTAYEDALKDLEALKEEQDALHETLAVKASEAEELERELNAVRLVVNDFTLAGDLTGLKLDQAVRTCINRARAMSPGVPTWVSDGHD